MLHGEYSRQWATGKAAEVFQERGLHLCIYKGLQGIAATSTFLLHQMENGKVRKEQAKTSRRAWEECEKKQTMSKCWKSNLEPRILRVEQWGWMELPLAEAGWHVTAFDGIHIKAFVCTSTASPGRHLFISICWRRICICSCICIQSASCERRQNSVKNE